MENKMGKVLKAGVMLTFGLCATGAFAQTESFCSATTHSSSNKVTISTNTTGKIGNIGYELWDENGHGGSATFYDDGSMDCSITSAKDYLCRAGLSLGSTQTYKDLNGDMIAEFKLVKNSGSNVGYSYIGVYGWMEGVSGTASNLVEYYVIDNTLAQSMPGSWIGNENKGTITVDGGTYTVYRNTRTGPAIKNSGNVTFYQYFSVRNSPRDCGTINISEHMRQWEKKGLVMGKLYEAKVLGEAGNVNGEVQGGHMDFPHARVYVGEPPAPPEPIDRKAYKGVKATVPGTIEAENFDEGNNGDSYEDTGNGDATSSAFEYRGTEYQVAIVDGGTGKSIGYTNADEWYEYTIDVTQDGEYEIEANVSNGSGAGTLGLSLDGKSLASLSFTGTDSDWDTYEKATGKATLSKGEHVLRITIASANTNVDYVKFSLPGASSGDDTGSQTGDNTNPQTGDNTNPQAGDNTNPQVGDNPGVTNPEDPQVIMNMGVVNVSRTYQVFDMQGKFLGKVEVAAGSSVVNAVATKFHKAGIYMVKNGSFAKRIAVK